MRIGHQLLRPPSQQSLLRLHGHEGEESALSAVAQTIQRAHFVHLFEITHRLDTNELGFAPGRVGFRVNGGLSSPTPAGDCRTPGRFENRIGDGLPVQAEPPNSPPASMLGLPLVRQVPAHAQDDEIQVEMSQWKPILRASRLPPLWPISPKPLMCPTPPRYLHPSPHNHFHTFTPDQFSVLLPRELLSRLWWT
jgi:hypothetical protein